MCPPPQVGLFEALEDPVLRAGPHHPSGRRQARRHEKRTYTNEALCILLSCASLTASFSLLSKSFLEDFVVLEVSDAMCFLMHPFMQRCNSVAWHPSCKGTPPFEGLGLTDQRSLPSRAALGSPGSSGNTVRLASASADSRKTGAWAQQCTCVQPMAVEDQLVVTLRESASQCTRGPRGSLSVDLHLSCCRDCRARIGSTE